MGRAEGSLLVLNGHEGDLTSVAFGDRDRRLVSGSRDGTARLWNLETGRLERTLTHGGEVDRVAFDPAGTRVLTAGSAATASLWNADSGERLAELTGHEGKILVAEFDSAGTRIVTGSADCTARVWDAKAGESIQVLRGHSGWIRAARFSPDGSRIATGSTDGTARVWNTATGACIAVLEHDDWVHAVAFSQDGERVLTGCADSSVAVWEVGTGAASRRLRPSDGAAVVTVWWSSDDRIGFSTWSSSFLVDLATAQPVGEDQHETGRVLAVRPDGQQVLALPSSGEPLAALWRLDLPTDATELRGHAAAILTAAYGRDGALAATGAADRSARVWSTHAAWSAPLPDTANARDVVWNRDGSMLLVVDRAPGLVRILDGNQGARLSTPSGAPTARGSRRRASGRRESGIPVPASRCKSSGTICRVPIRSFTLGAPMARCC
jgi:WD40 repeat protein